MGDTWDVQTNLETSMAATMKSQFTFAAIEEDHLLITGKSTIETADKDAYVKNNGMPMKYDLSGTTIASIKIDPTSGWIIDARTKQQMSGTAYINDNPKIPGGMEIPMTMTSETIVHE